MGNARDRSRKKQKIPPALRKLKKETKGIGGKGTLTDSLIDKLQNFCGIAIRSNSGDLEGMKSSIHASLFHCASSGRRNLHTHCPQGPDSWCRYNQDKANNTSLATVFSSNTLFFLRTSSQTT